MADTLDTAGAVAGYLNNERTPQQLGADARYAMTNAVGGNPDYEAELRGVARRTGVPVDTVRAYPDEMRKQATLGAYDFDSMAAQFPGTTKFLSDQDNAHLAHDDSDSLSGLEAYARSLASGFGQTPNMAMQGTGELLNVGQRAAGGLAALLLPRPRTGPMGLTPQSPTIESLAGPLLGEDMRQLGKDGVAYYRKNVAVPAISQTFGMQVAEGLGQVAGQIAMLPIDRGLSLFAQGAAIVADKVEPDNAPQWKKDLAVLGGAAVTGVTEKWALDKLLGPMAVPIKNQIGAVLARVGIASASESGQEFTENILHDTLRVLLTNPDAKIDLTEAVGSAAVGASVGGIVRSIVEAGLHIRRRGNVQEAEYQSQQAEQHAQVFEAMQQTAETSKLKARSPDTLRSYMQSLADEGAANVFIDSSKLVEAGIDMQALAQLIPSIASQLDQVQTGGDLVIPTGELLTNSIGSEFAQSLIEHARTEENGMSRAEAKVYMQSQGDTINAEIERVMLEKDNDAEFKAERDTVQAQILTQLNEVKRFTSKVNEQYAGLAANFYAVMAARTGMSVTQFADTYKLGFTENSFGGSGSYDQARGTNEAMTNPKDVVGNSQGGRSADDNTMGTDDATGLPLNGDGTVTVYHHTSAASAQAIRKTGTLKAQAEPDVYVTTHQETDTGYGDTAVPIRVRPDQLSIDDEFPSGRKDFRLNVGKPGGSIKVTVSNESPALARGATDDLTPGVQSSELLLEEAKSLRSQGRALELHLRDFYGQDEQGYKVHLWPESSKREYDEKYRKAAALTETAQEIEKKKYESNPERIKRKKQFLRAVENAIEAGEYVSYGIRGNSKNPRTGKDVKVKIGSVARPSYYQPDGNTTNTQHGTSAITVDVESIESSFDLAKRYIARGEKILLLGSDSTKGGNDRGEVEMNNAKILAIYDDNIPNEPTAPDSGGAFNQDARGQISFADDITRQASIISMLKGADLSTFIHEGGHFFLEVQSDLAARIAGRMAQGEAVGAGEQSIVSDMNATLDWMGIKGAPGQSALLEWVTMPLEEKRQYHEQWARGFEAYAFEGKSPSMELQKMFQTFRAWLVNVYRGILKSVNAGKTDIAGALKVELSPEVRAVMDRMLATSNQIAEAEAARSMGPLFKTAEEAGMSMDEFKAYHDAGMQSTMDAVDELQARSLKDLQWAQNAKSRKLKELQKAHDALRREAMMAVRAEVMSEDVYRAWTFLTARQAKPNEPSSIQTEYAKEVVDHKQRRVEAEDAAGKAEKEKLYAANPEVKGLQRGQLITKNKRQSAINVQQAMLEWDKANPAPAKPVADAVDVPPEFATGKLDTKALREAYGAKDDAIWRKLSALRMTSDETGRHPDVVANDFGFDSGDELVQKLATAENPKDLIARLTDERMLQEHGDLATPAGIERAADEAIHNEARARFVATELKALQNAMSVREKVPGKKHTVDVLVQAAKEYAAGVIAKLKVRDIRPGQYAAAEVRSARAAAKAGSDIEQAGLHKRNQLINLYATKAAYAAQDEVKAMAAYFKTFGKRSKTIDSGYLDQIEQLLERFDFRQVSLKTIDRRKSLAAWYAEQEEAGNPPDVPDSLMQDAARKSFRDATVEELRGLRDTIKQIEHQGRLKNKLLLARDQRSFDVIADAMADSIVAYGGPERPVNLEGPAPVTDWFAGLRASHRKLASLFRQMDGNQDAGTMYQTIGRAMNERGTMEDVMVEKATEALREIYAPMLALRGGLTGYRSKLYIREIDASLTRGGRLSVALNWGNEANRQRIMDGDKWSEAQVRAILKTLSVQELKFVNQVHEYLDSFWPEIAAKELRLTGVTPEKVEATPYTATAADGSAVHMRGGYYPLKYDTDRSDKADTQEAAQAAKEMMQGVMTRATTRRGHTKERLKEVKRAVRKDLNVITQHVTQVTHDLAWHEWLIDTNKLLSDGRIVDAIRSHYGPKVLKTMRDGVLGIATADVAPQTDIDKAMLLLRSNVTRATMGASLTTAFLQPFGLTQSMVRIGPKHVLRGAARWAGDAARMESSMVWIKEKSDFMRLRSKTFNKELREIRGSVAGKSKAVQVYDAGLFFFMQKMQMVADVPTWIGQYEKSLAGGLDEAAAVAMADRVVLESQGGGNTKDLAEVQRKHPMLTQFYSYFSVTLNLTAEQTAATDFKNPRAVAGWLGDMALLLVIPAILPALLMHAIKGGGDDDEAAWAARIAKWQLGYLMGMVVGVRELSGAVSGFDYAGPPVGRIVGDIGKAGAQTVQGEVDEPAVMAYIKLMGTAFGIPIVQALRSYKGWKAWDEGEEDAGPQSVPFGPPSKD